MKQITNKQYEEYRQFIEDTTGGAVMSRTALKMICRSCDNDPQKIGMHILESLGMSSRVVPKTPIIDLNDDDFGAVINCAIRYCLGRATYMPGLVTDYVRPLLPHLNAKTLRVMEQDIVEQERFGYGMECDKATWMRFLEDVRRAMR